MELDTRLFGSGKSSENLLDIRSRIDRYAPVPVRVVLLYPFMMSRKMPPRGRWGAPEGMGVRVCGGDGDRVSITALDSENHSAW